MLQMSIVMSARNSKSSAVIQELHKLATENLQTIERMGVCAEPKLQIVYPNDEASKVYLPRGTLLHRCSNIWGCCQDSTHSCEPIESHEVPVVFYWKSIKMQSRNSRKYNLNLEVINMQNHTKCACVKRT